MALKASPIGRSHVATTLERIVRKVYFDEYDKRGNQYDALFNIAGMDKQTVTDVVQAGVGQFQLQAEGGPWNYDTGQEAWNRTYTALEYSLGIQMTRVMIEDELYGFAKKIGGNLGRAAAYTREVLAATLFNSLSATVYTAESTAYTLLSTTHFLVTGDTWSNRPATSVDLSNEALESALAAFRTNMVDQRGLKQNISPRWLVVGPQDEFLGARILESDKRQGTADNDINAIARRRNLELFVWDFLTDDTRWFLVAEKGDTAITWLNRRATRMDRFDDTANGNVNMVGSFRSASGATHVGGVYGSP